MAELTTDEVSRERIAALKDLLLAEIRRLDEAVTAHDRAAVLLNARNQIAQDKFEATVERDSVKQNEFRGALDDLGKTMATRRELEAFMDQYRRAHTDLEHTVGDLRSRLDVGPVQLATLQAQADRIVGRQQGVGLSANVAAVVLGMFLTVAGIIVAAYIATH